MRSAAPSTLSTRAMKSPESRARKKVRPPGRRRHRRCPGTPTPPRGTAVARRVRRRSRHAAPRAVGPRDGRARLCCDEHFSPRCAAWVISRRWVGPPGYVPLPYTHLPVGFSLTHRHTHTPPTWPLPHSHTHLPLGLSLIHSPTPHSCRGDFRLVRGPFRRDRQVRV